MTYTCPNHTATHGYEPCCACGGWEPDDPNTGRQCTEADDDLDDLTFTELIERSSLGTPEAKAIRARTPPEITQEILRRVYEANEEGHTPPDDENDT